MKIKIPMTEFRPGDRVQWLDEDLEGRVIASEPGQVRIRTRDGFEFMAPPEALVRVPESISLSVPQEASFLSEKAQRKPGPAQKKGKKARYGPVMEIDLHVEKLSPAAKKMEAHEILDLQLETARRQIEFAIRRRIQRIVFIHGVGEGVLRAELHTLFRRFDGVRYQDADPREYGMGATEVYIPQECF